MEEKEEKMAVAENIDITVAETLPAVENNPIESKLTLFTKLNERFGDETSPDKLNAIVKQLIQENQILVFSKTWCPFCLETKRTLSDFKIPFAVVELDELNSGAIIQKELTNINGQKTVPHVYINQKHIGGCNDFKTYIQNGHLNNLINEYRDKDKKIKELERQLYTSDANSISNKNNAAFQCLFWFPSTLNANTVRVLGVMSVIICIFGLIFNDKKEMHWVVFGLFCDYTIRFFAGASMSPMGTAANIIVSQLKPKFSPGPPKQFASMCGLMFSGGAALLFRTGHIIPGCVVLGILLVCAFLEGFVNFCVGCFFFGLMVHFKLIPPSVYKLHLNTKDERQLIYDEAFTRLNEGPYKKNAKFVDPDIPRLTDLYYKIKSDEQKQEDFHIIRHLRVSMYSMILGVSALSLVWKSISEFDKEPFKDSDDIDREVSDALLAISFVLFCIVTILYLAKCIFYTKKVIKEFQHPSMVNFFAAIPMNIMIYILLSFEKKDLNGNDSNKVEDFYHCMFWICAIANLLLFLHINATWIQRRLTMENIDASWLFLPISNLMAAFVGVNLDSKSFSDELWLWLSSGLLFAIILFPIVFLKSVVGSNSDARNRNNLLILCAVPVFIGLGFESMQINNDISRAMYWCGIYLALIMAVLFFYKFLGAAKFDQSYYSFGFSLCAVAIGAIKLFNIAKSQHTNKISSFYYVVTYAFIIAANIAVCVNVLHTIYAIAQLRLLRPIIPKWGVLSFMRLTHEAFRGWMKRMQTILDENSEDVSKLNIGQIAAEWNVVSLVHEEHARHEDEVIYKEANTLFPGFTHVADDDHKQHEKMISEINGMLSKLNGGIASDNTADEDALQLKKQLLNKLKHYMSELEEHLLWEEGHIQPILRKYVPNQLQKIILEKVWEATDYSKWSILIPWILRNQHKLPQRILFLKTLMWAMPYRCQQIGLIVHRGCNDVLWADIAQQLPELIPRGLNGWRRQY